MATSLTTARRVDRPLLGSIPALAGICGPALFTLVFLAQGLLRTDHDPIAQPVSALEAGPHGWIQQANFVVFGACLLLFAAGLDRHMARARLSWVATVLLAASGFALWLAAALPLRLGAEGEVYDPGFHYAAGVTYFLSSALALIALSRRMRTDPRWQSLASYTLAAGLVALAAFFVMGVLVMPEGAPGHAYAGLVQRSTIMLVTFPCLVVAGLRLRGLSASSAQA